MAITGNTIHPIRSIDRQEWAPLAELAEGEHVLSPPPSPPWGRGTEGEGAAAAVVLSVTLSRVSQSVYNIEVHGEHVYQVGALGVLVHNAAHHCNPVAFGNDIPYGHRLLTYLSDAVHSKVHSALNAYLQAQHGKTLYAGKQWWTTNKTWQDRYKTIINFYREFDKANNTNLFQSFMAEIRNGIISGFNPLGR